MWPPGSLGGRGWCSLAGGCRGHHGRDGLARWAGLGRGRGREGQIQGRNWTGAVGKQEVGCTLGRLLCMDRRRRSGRTWLRWPTCFRRSPSGCCTVGGRCRTGRWCSEFRQAGRAPIGSRWRQLLDLWHTVAQAQALWHSCAELSPIPALVRVRREIGGKDMWEDEDKFLNS